MNNDSKGDRMTRTITITSGMGGVGKTNAAVSLAVALAKIGKKVMIFDADIGLGNIDVLLDLAAAYDIHHVLNGEKGLMDVIIEGPHGIRILPASSGVQEMTDLDEFQRMRLIEEFEASDIDIDYLLIDTGAGISENVAFFCIAAQEIIVVTSPEPTSMSDAYALIKVLFTRYQEKDFKVLVNLAKDRYDAIEVFRRLSLATEKFPSISLDYLGYIPLDDSIQNAVMARKAFIDADPGSRAAKHISAIASRLVRERPSRVKGTLQLSWGNLVREKWNVPV
jgi:flagellar biosynthesis protein FlhG